MVELVRAGRDPVDLAREFEPTAQSICHWVTQADRQEGRREEKGDGLAAAERDDLARLRRENKQLRLEREILSRAAAWFARETYGALRVHAQLQADGGRHGRKRIARLMRAAGLVGASRRRDGVTTTRRDKDARPAPDLVDRNFVASKPNQLWVADITFVPTAGGFLYLAVVLDAWSRKIVGWSMANHLRAELVLAALEMAIGQRRPGDVIHHSDQGSQYTSLAFGKRCHEAGVRPSMGSVGDAYDNAMCESFFATLECELLDRRRFASQVEARMACFSFIEGWYNPVRLHSALGYRSPMDFEAATEAVIAPT